MDSDDDDIKLFGTAFDQLESHEIASKKPEIDQTVRDEKGRRRFHGAFTGGFSAGYWNTVGSAEGFTPQMFKSSRKNKYDATTSSKPEDFMDEEDFSAYGIAPKKVHTTDDFVDNIQFAGMRGSTFDDAIRSVMSTTQESIGKRLFRKMKRSAQIEKKIKYGHHLLIRDSIKSQKIETIKYQDVDFKCKDNFHGIGYTGAIDANKYLFKATEFVGKDSVNNRQNTIQTTISGGKRLKISGEAFGVGALEEDDEYGGMSIYFNDDMSQYDFELGKKEEKTQIKKKRKFKDTRNVDPNQVGLESFRRSSKGTNLFDELRRYYRLPELPKGWKPKPIGKSDSEIKKSRWDSKTSESIPVIKKFDENVKKSNPVMNANVRSMLIGDEVVYKTGVIKKPSSQTTFVPPNPTPQPKPLTGLLASKFRSSNASSSSSSTPDDVQLNAGLSTFAQVSQQNQEFVMKNKNNQIIFDCDKEVEAPTRMIFEWHPHRLLCKRFGLQNPFFNNPHVGIVGSYDSCLKLQQLKNDQISPSTSSSSVADKTLLNDKKIFTNLFHNLSEVNDYYSEKEPPLGEEFDRFKINEKSKVDHEKSIEDLTAVLPRASKEILKSVFASDEEDLNSDDPDDDNVDEDARTENSIQNEPPPNRDTKSGLFSGIDFKAVNAQKFNDSESLLFKRDKTQNNHQDDDDDEDYGPALPPSLSINIDKNISYKIENEHSIKKKKNKKEKKSKKSKKKLKKKDKKKKDNKRRKNHQTSPSPSSSSSSSEDDNNDTELDAKIMAFIQQARQNAS